MMTAFMNSPKKMPVNAYAKWINGMQDKFVTIPTKGMHYNEHMNALANQSQNPLDGLTKRIPSKFVSLLTNNVEFNRFEKTPELGGIELPRLPLTFSILMFFFTMIPARMHSEWLRAPKFTDTKGTADPSDDEEKKDLRAVRDVAIRDIASITLFLFALEPVKHALLTKKHRDGSVFSMGKSNQPRIMLMQGGYSPRQDLHAIGYPELKQIYRLHSDSPEAFAKLAGRSDANDKLHWVIDHELEELPLYKKSSEDILKDIHRTPKHHTERRAQLEAHLKANMALKEQGGLLTSDLRSMGAAKSRLKSTILGVANSHGPERLSNISNGPDLLIQRLFDITALDTHKNIQKLTLDHLKAHVQKELNADRKAADQSALKVLSGTPEEKALKQAAKQSIAYRDFIAQYDVAMSTGNKNAFNKIADLAHNADGFLDKLTRAVIDDQKRAGKDANYHQTYSKVRGWMTDHLEEQVAKHRASVNLMKVLNTDDAGQRIVNELKNMYSHSANASNHLQTLTKTVENFQTGKDAKHFGASVNVLGNVVPLPVVDKMSDALRLNTFKRFEPREILAKASHKMRSPVGAMSFMFVAAVVGFTPVWLNQAVTETEYRLEKRKRAKLAEKQAAEPKASQTKLDIQQ